MKKIIEAVTVSLSVAYLGVTGYFVAEHLQDGGWEKMQLTAKARAARNTGGVDAQTKTARNAAKYQPQFWVPMGFPAAVYYPYYVPYQR